MTETPPGICMAGRTAFFEGKWKTPCPNQARHRIANPAIDPIELCDDHFQDVHEAGLVTDPNISPEEFEQREAERRAR